MTPAQELIEFSKGILLADKKFAESITGIVTKQLMQSLETALEALNGLYNVHSKEKPSAAYVQNLKEAIDKINAIAEGK